MLDSVVVPSRKFWAFCLEGRFDVLCCGMEASSSLELELNKNIGGHVVRARATATVGFEVLMLARFWSRSWPIDPSDLLTLSTESSILGRDLVV